jgi:hypothetical protein
MIKIVAYKAFTFTFRNLEYFWFLNKFSVKTFFITHLKKLIYQIIFKKLRNNFFYCAPVAYF